MGMLIFSGLTFVVEKDANPDEFISLPAALYWAIITMTSVCAFYKTSLSFSVFQVGYGDITPKTWFGEETFFQHFLLNFLFDPIP